MNPPVPQPDLSFPCRVAGVDVGSNALRILIAAFTGPGQFQPLVMRRMPVRLGHSVFLTGSLTETAQAAALDALQTFAALMAEHGVTQSRAVATSAVREATNGLAFAERVKAHTGLTLEVIGGGEEARLVHAALCSRVDMDGQRWVSADLGGGSVEVSLMDAQGILWSESHAIGSVRLLEELSGSGDEPGRFRRLLEEYLGALRLPQVTERFRPAGLLATGGNIETLARLAGGPEDSRGRITLPLADLRNTIERLSRMSYRERVEDLGLREDRADVILPAAMVYERLAVLAGVDALLVPNVGVREGLVLDLVERHATPDHSDRRREHQVASACLTLARRCLVDEAHVRHVSTLALSLFDQLAPVHGLSQEDRHILCAAALLHDVGTFISPKKHHRHSHYLMLHAELPGLTDAEQRLAAVTARFHRKAEPSLRHPEFAALEPDEQHRVHRLVGLLRLADALDRDHRQRVRAVRASVTKGALRLGLDAGGDICLEQWAVGRKGDYLARHLGLSLQVRPSL